MLCHAGIHLKDHLALSDHRLDAFTLSDEVRCSLIPMSAILVVSLITLISYEKGHVGMGRGINLSVCMPVPEETLVSGLCVWCGF